MKVGKKFFQEILALLAFAPIVLPGMVLSLQIPSLFLFQYTGFAEMGSPGGNSEKNGQVGGLVVQ